MIYQHELAFEAGAYRGVKQNTRTGQWYAEPKSKANRDQLAALLEREGIKLAETWTGVVHLYIRQEYPWITGHGKRIREVLRWVWRTATPDADNLLKQVADVMKRSNWFKDDRQIAGGAAYKQHTGRRVLGWILWFVPPMGTPEYDDEWDDVMTRVWRWGLSERRRQLMEGGCAEQLPLFGGARGS